MVEGRNEPWIGPAHCLDDCIPLGRVTPLLDAISQNASHVVSICVISGDRCEDGVAVRLLQKRLVKVIAIHDRKARILPSSC